MFHAPDEKRERDFISETRFIRATTKSYFYAVLRKGLSMSDAVQEDNKDTFKHVAISKMEIEIPD
jgi:hypothetical protein